MKLVTAKKPSDITLKGIKVEFDVIDGSVKGVILTDEEGNFARFACESYNFQAQVKAPPKIVEKYRVHGTVLDIPVDHTVDQSYEADEIISKYAGKVYRDEDINLEKEIVKVEVFE